MGNIRFNGFAGFMAVLALLFISCDTKNELPDNGLSGGEVAVRIRSMGMAEGGSESLARAFSRKEPEMVSTPVGDGMLLEMSIKEDEASLRDKIELTTGAYFRIIAVEAGTTKYYSHGDYTYGNPSTLLTDFHVKIGKEYDYICFSHNKTTNTLPSQSYSVGTALPSPSFTINTSTDNPLWCKITGLGEVTSAGVELDILLKRRLAKVKVKIDCAYNGWKITGVADNQVAVVVNDPAYDCTLDWGTGILSGTSLDQGLTYSISDNTLTYQISNEVTIIPNGSNAVIKFKANTISRDGYAAAVPTAEKSATLAQALSGGVNYTITMRLRTPIFARSNIYWDATAQKLTFEPAADDPEDNDDSKAGYQGVFFRCGSLVGISPARTLDENYAGESVMTDDFIPTTPIYVPIVRSPLTSSTWKATNGNSIISSMYNDMDASVRYNYTVWTYNAQTGDSYIVYPNQTGDIPHMDNSRGGGSSDLNNTWLADDERNIYDVYKGLRGDICQYLCKTGAVTGNYRLPIPNEFGLYPDWWVGSFGANGLNADGTSIIEGYGLNTPMNVTFPSSGHRRSTTSAIYGVGHGYYWSSSPGCDLYFPAMNIVSIGRGAALPVRCIKY
jgi:hypothetical protein